MIKILVGITFSASVFMTGCGGGGQSATLGPTVTNISFSGTGDTQLVTYSNGSTATNTATSAPVTWASDHVTKTITYTFADSSTNPVVSTVIPTTSNPNLTVADYPSNWTTSGTVTLPAVSSVATTYGDGYVSTAQDGSSSKPFLQTTLAALSLPITDPSAYVYSATTLYDLRWGVPDKTGPAHANLFGSGAAVFPAQTIMGLSVTGQCSSYPCSTGFTLNAPHQDVFDAWNKGWTGKGSNILMIDNYSVNNDFTHGITTMLIANRYAKGASMFGFDIQYMSTVQSYTGTNITSPTNMNAVNLSFTYTPISVQCNNGCGTIPSNSDYQAAIGSTSSSNSILVGYLSGQNPLPNTIATNSVITKAAGNGAIPAHYDTTTLALSQNASTVSRLLVVGALNTVGTTSAPATIANYSNTAGTNAVIQGRFLVESGTAPFSNGAIAVNGTPINFTGNNGTSYAAPRVAGYAAIVMQKFPNLNAANTSSIFLDTARTDTLTCYPNCLPDIYGKGEASLSRALAPVGRLR